MRNSHRISVLFLGGLFGSYAFAQTCSNNSVTGSYGYLATFAAPGTASTGTGTGTTTPTFSNTPEGNLLTGIMGTTGSSVSSNLYFDGNGGIWAAQTAAAPFQFISGSQAGTYSVTSDCAISVSLTDAFTTATTPQTPVKLTGFLVKSGTEMYLAYSTPVAAGQSVPTGNVALSNRTILRLVRVINYSGGCSVATLNGAYGLVGSGITSQTTGSGVTATTSLVPSNFLARIRFDGTGKLVSDTVPTGSPLGTFQQTGTYTVNNDCSGQLALTQSSSTTAGTLTTTTVTNTTVRFLITPPVSIVDYRGQAAFQNLFDLKPGLVFAISDGNQTINGIGSAQ
ncbi:MAG: hypothetical protein ABI811_08205 [Acidobacteriota bacterium]